MAALEAGGQLAFPREGVGAFEELLATKGPVQAAEWASTNRQIYKDDKVAWRPLLDRLSGPDKDGRDIGYLRKMTMPDLLRFVKILASDAQVTQSSFWEKVTEATRSTYSHTGLDGLEDNLELARLYTKIGAWHRDVFEAVFENNELPGEGRQQKVRRLTNLHGMPFKQLVDVLSIFARAGSASLQISGWATRAFNAARERIQEEDPEVEWQDFSTEQMLSIIDSMARFSTQNNETILRKFGRERLHPKLLQLEPKDVAKLCSAYSHLGFQHHTVFKEVLLAISDEQQQIQRQRILGLTAAGAEEKFRFGSTEMALILDAMLVLKLYRGNNPWFAWGQRFQDLTEIFMRRLETSKDLEHMAARPLAAGAYALGRAKKGSEGLCQSMMARMMTLLEKDDSDPDKSFHRQDFPDAPQDHLERFVFGIAMMGPSKRKEFLDTEWLREWMCNSYYKLSLQNIVRINRYLVQIRSFDKAYLEVFVEFFCANMEQLTKSDVQDLTHTYNHARLGEEAIGRHFFWALGRQFQQQHVKRVAAKTGRRRPALERYG